MALLTTLIPGTVWIPGDDVTPTKLNLTANPTVTTTGATTDLSNFSTTAPTNGQMLVWNATTGKWTPTAIPVSTSDTFNKIYSWAHFF